MTAQDQQSRELLELAREAGLASPMGQWAGIAGFTLSHSATRFAALVAAKEREACALIAAEFGQSRPIVTPNPSQKIVGRWEGEQAASQGIAATIRARV